MKKLILAVATVISLSPIAHAGDWENANNNYSFCDRMGNTASLYFTSIRGNDAGSQRIIQRAIAQAKTFLSDSPDAMDSMVFAIKYGSYQATSSDDAYRAAFAHCMDDFGE